MKKKLRKKDIPVFIDGLKYSPNNDVAIVQSLFSEIDVSRAWSAYITNKLGSKLQDENYSKNSKGKFRSFLFKVNGTYYNIRVPYDKRIPFSFGILTKSNKFDLKFTEPQPDSWTPSWDRFNDYDFNLSSGIDKLLGGR